MHLQLAFFVLLSVVVSQAAHIKGKVASSVTGEGLARVGVSILENKFVTITSPSGEFEFSNLPQRSYTLRLNAVGYRLLTIPFTVSTSSDAKEFSISMVPDNLQISDTR